MSEFDRPLVKYNAENNNFEVRQATKQGYIECKNGGVADLSYPDSKLRRGRVQEDGDVSPTLTAESSGVSVLKREPVCLNSKGGRNGVDGLQPSVQDRVYDSNSVSTAVTTSYMPNYTDGLRIRKLTPRECWRLQGWCFRREDGTWDDTAFEKAKAAGVSDSQLYKQAGNGCSANITQTIGYALLSVGEKQGEDKV